MFSIFFLLTPFLEVGNSPLLSTEWKEDNKVNVSCESGGWYPEPTLRWSDQKQVLTPKSLQYSKDSSGLLSVHSWLLVSGSSEASCSVGLLDEEAKEARVRLENPPQPAKQGKENDLHVYNRCIFFIFFMYRFLFFYLESGSSVAGWVAFALLLIATLVALGVLFFKKRGKCFFRFL